MDDRVRCPENPGRLCFFAPSPSDVGAELEDGPRAWLAGLHVWHVCAHGSNPCLHKLLGCLWGLKWAAMRGSLGLMVAYLARSALGSGDYPELSPQEFPVPSLSQPLGDQGMLYGVRRKASLPLLTETNLLSEFSSVSKT